MACKYRIVHSIMLLFCTNALVGMNLTSLHEIFFRPELMNERQIFSVLAEAGIGHARAFNEEGCHIPIVRMWEPEQNSITMLQGFSEGSPQGQLLDHLQGVDIAPIDDGVRGRFCVDGDLALQYSVQVGYQHCLPLNFSVGLYLPFYAMTLKHVAWHNLTRDVADPDKRVRAYLTDNFFAHVKELSGGLELGSWQRAGLGDLTMLLEWNRDFPQKKPMLKNVRLNMRFGPTLPTGKRADINKIFALPFGTDGALGLTFGGGLMLFWGDYVRAGLEVELFHTFGNTRTRRIKTDVNQTELLLLQKACVYTDFGLRQQFDIFMEFAKFYRGLFGTIYYEFVKQGENRVSLISDNFAPAIANSASSLQEWTAHTIIAKWGYDFEDILCEDAWAKPKLSFFVKAPFKGRNAALFTSFGVIADFKF